MKRPQVDAGAEDPYADELESDEVAATIDAVNADGSTRFAVGASRRTLADSAEEW